MLCVQEKEESAGRYCDHPSTRKRGYARSHENECQNPGPDLDHRALRLKAEQRKWETHCDGKRHVVLVTDITTRATATMKYRIDGDIRQCEEPDSDYALPALWSSHHPGKSNCDTDERGVDES